MTRKEKVELAGRVVLEYQEVKRDLESLKIQARSLADGLESIRDVLLGNRTGSYSHDTEKGAVFHVSKRNGGIETDIPIPYPDAKKMMSVIADLNEKEARLKELQECKKGLGLD